MGEQFSQRCSFENLEALLDYLIVKTNSFMQGSVLNVQLNRVGIESFASRILLKVQWYRSNKPSICYMYTKHALI